MSILNVKEIQKDKNGRDVLIAESKATVTSVNPVVFFDGACPVCSKEINMVKKANDGKLCFVDVHSICENSEKDKATLLRDLHIQQAHNQWLVGLDANIYLWESMKNSSFKRAWLFLFFAKVLKWPIIRNFAQHAYRYWADRRYQKFYGNN